MSEAPEQPIESLPAVRGAFSLEPKTFEEAKELASMMARSQLVPAAYQGQPHDILVAVQMGAEVGLKPMQALQNIAVINGRPSLWGDALIGLVRASPFCLYVHETFDEETQTATCATHRRGENEPETRTFSRADAEQAGLWGKNVWKQYPRRMLQMRARGFCLRDVYADVLKGLHVAEEVGDYIDGDFTVEPVRRATGPGETLTERVRQGAPAGPAPAAREEPAPAAREEPAAAEPEEPAPTDPLAELRADDGTLEQCEESAAHVVRLLREAGSIEAIAEAMDLVRGWKANAIKRRVTDAEADALRRAEGEQSGAA